MNDRRNEIERLVDELGYATIDDIQDLNKCKANVMSAIDSLLADAERAEKERDEYKIWWERDSTSLGKVLAQLSMERASKEDFRARAATLKWLEPAVEKMQRAIAFWHPGVVGNNPAFLDRAGDDAELLFGYEGLGEPSAVDLGWIVVTDAAIAQEQKRD